MPIRTNRGRAAVYRKLWGWPMRSPRHLVISATVFAVFITAVGIIVPQLTGDDAPRDATADPGSGSASATSSTGARGAGPGSGGNTTTGTPTPTASLPTRVSPTQSPTPAQAAPEALETATQWAKAWVRHPEGTTLEQWLDGLRPFTTEETLGEMASVDLANIQATEVTGPATPTASFTSSVEVRVPTNGGNLSITVIRSSVGWRVNHYEQAA